jgi:hypothetical protein
MFTVGRGAAGAASLDRAGNRFGARHEHGPAWCFEGLRRPSPFVDGIKMDPLKPASSRAGSIGAAHEILSARLPCPTNMNFFSSASGNGPTSSGRRPARRRATSSASGMPPRSTIDQEEAKLDKEVADSFPASDPPSSSVVTGATGEHPAAAEEAAASRPAERGTRSEARRVRRTLSVRRHRHAARDQLRHLLRQCRGHGALPLRRHRRPPSRSGSPSPNARTAIWHCHLPGIGRGQVYGWRVSGPWAPEAGHRFNPAKLLLDPYARSSWARSAGTTRCTPIPSAPATMRT